MRDIRKMNWFWIDNAIFEREDIEPLEKLIYMALARFSNNETGKTFPSIETLCNATGIKDERTIKKYLKNLANKGIIEIITRSGKSNLYHLKNIELPPTNDEGAYNVPPTSDVPTPPTLNEGTPPTSDVPRTILSLQDSFNNTLSSEREEKNKINVGMLRQEISFLIGVRQIRVQQIINLNHFKTLEEFMERVRAVFKFANENQKGDGWIIGAIRDNYKLELAKNKPKNEEYFYKSAESMEVLQ